MRLGIFFKIESTESIKTTKLSKPHLINACFNVYKSRLQILILNRLKRWQKWLRFMNGGIIVNNDIPVNQMNCKYI